MKEILISLTNKNIKCEIDKRKNHKPGWKFSEYEMKGVPIRLALGPKDLSNNTIEIARRDNLTKETINFIEIEETIPKLLDEIQENLYNKALKFREENSREVNNYEEFKKIFNKKNGFVYAHWDGTSETEELIKKDTKATIRCIPNKSTKKSGKCIVSGKESKGLVVFGKAY